MSLKVIGAGFPRTATWSLKLALEQLGLGPCYHMSEALEHPEHWPLWETAASGGSVDWHSIFSDWGSTTDAPACHFYRELAAYYPDAKVVLSERDEERWFASTQNTILSGGTAGFHEARGSLGMVDAVGWGTDPRLRDKAYMLDRYRRHNDEVRRTIPADRLLVYDPAEGWAPLCRFLGRPVPDTPFPRVNSTDDFRAMIAEREHTGGSIADAYEKAGKGEAASLKVIGAGLPRTGTLSMKAALEQLGFGRCYHMAEIFNAPWRAEAWTQYFQGGPMDWDKVFEGFGATVDAPACLAWRSLADRYPAAKIVLTVRDREAWCESMLNTVLSERHQSSIMGAPLAPMFQAMNGPFMQVAGVPPTQGEPPPGPPPREVLYALYEGQRAAVREGVPAERLLEFDVREGWEPLCRFLGVEAPPTSFPRVNDSGTFHDHFSPAVAAEA